MNLDVLSKSYDIRGVYPTEIDEALYYEIGMGFGKLMDNSNFAVGYDARLSGESLKDALIQGILDSGNNVFDIGLCSTDMIYFSSGFYDDIDVGIMITASHNPKEYNGLKSCLKFAVPINMKDFSKELIDFIENGNKQIREKKGTYIEKDILDDWINHILSFIDIKNIKPLKIVADAGNGVAGVFMEKLAERLGIDMIPLYFEADGNFPNHHPNPIERENMQDLLNKVISENADLGVAFDGDADRMYICDEKGDIWSGTITTAMIAKTILQKNPGKKIVYNTVSGKIVSETIESSGGIGIKEKVGHVYIKETMKKDPDIVFAGEHSGHYFFQNNWNADSGVIAFAIVLELICNENKKSSEIKEEFDVYHAIDEINSKVNDVKQKISELKDIYKDGKIEENDGLTVIFNDFWFNVRPSSNEPLLRLNVEAISKDLAKEKEKEILEIIRKI
ncbi:MAG: phosphomannomutase/phosphoglucomutase [Candidatus Gracilibacteria bacterium]|nr:phosphomannomutase/phosphoglucomutase [Candidatus Gracilibacteria bacterium]